MEHLEISPVAQRNTQHASMVAGKAIEALLYRDDFCEFWDNLEYGEKILAEAEIAAAISDELSADFDTYQEAAHETSLNTTVGGDSVVYPVLGLCNEAGELAGKIKKIHRDRGGVIGPEQQEALKAECSDVLWYLAEICTQLGLTLAEVAAYNLDKLASRTARGVIQGSGDNR